MRILVGILLILLLVSCSQAMSDLPELMIQVVDYDGHVLNYRFKPSDVSFHLQPAEQTPEVGEPAVLPSGLTEGQLSGLATKLELMELTRDEFEVVQAKDYTLAKTSVVLEESKELILVFYKTDLHWIWLFERKGARVYSSEGEHLTTDLYLPAKELVLP